MHESISPEVRARIKKLKLLLLDVDGVLTDGRILVGNSGDELRSFDILDGFGLQLLRRAGIPHVIVTAKKSKGVSLRAREIKTALVFQNVSDKLAVLEKVAKRFKLKWDAIGFVGDDLIDLPLMRRVGFAATVPNAVGEIQEIAHYVTQRRGGRGAVREVADLILKVQGKWEEVTARYYQ